MELEYIIVQAGGKGTRMDTLTRNKPKALVPVDNLPMLFHLFRLFPKQKYIIIGDYKYEVLERYLRAFAEVDYTLIQATGHTGTCAGLSAAVSHVPAHTRFMLIWCDLVLDKHYAVPASDENIIGISKDFPCRWKYEDGKFSEERSETDGVAGHFIFQDKSYLEAVPEDGEFVRWLQEQAYRFAPQPLYHAHEYGIFSEWDKLPKAKCRPFNRVRAEGGRFYKEPLDQQGRELAEREQAWYRKLAEAGTGAYLGKDAGADVPAGTGLGAEAGTGQSGGERGKMYASIRKHIPQIYAYDPLCMELVDGKNIYEYEDLEMEGKRRILREIIGCLRSLHALGSIPPDAGSYREAYLDKTYGRLEKVRALVPFANDPAIRINGRICRNIFFHQEEVERMVMGYMPRTFCFLHGDCTFSNIMLQRDEIPKLIDPRGYFGFTRFYGDPAYDWVKLYYSLHSNYDQFNLKRFTLSMQEGGVEVHCASNHWEALEDDFFALLEGEVTRKQMMLFLAITWLSLTTYAWEDYDSICGAFYYGLYYLEEALEMGEQKRTNRYFDDNMRVIEAALDSVREEDMERLIGDCEETVRAGHKIVVSGLGKNVPICDKFVGTMLSLGLDAGFLHTNSAVHGDMGMVRDGDLVILLTKSGSTQESVYLYERLRESKPGARLWLLTFSEGGKLSERMERKLLIRLAHEGDLWDIVPNNSTTVNLIVLQTVAIELSRRLHLDLERDFKPNHPGGAIGEHLGGV